MQFPDSVTDVLPIIKPSDFYVDVNGAIFSVIANFVSEGRSVDPVLVTQRMQSLGINTIHDVAIGDYILAISRSDRIAEDSFRERFQELKKLSVLRNLKKMNSDIGKLIDSNTDKSISQIIGMVEQKFGEVVNVFEEDDAPCSIFEQISDFIEERGNNPQEVGIVAPYEEFRKLYGDFLNGGFYVFAAPPKSGKSTFLMDICDKVTVDSEEVHALYLDTELTSEEVMLRLAFKLSGTKEFYLRNGSWRKDCQMERAVRQTLEKIDKGRNKNVDHLYVANRPIGEIISMVRRWHYKKIREGKKAIVFYDYLKLTGESISDAWKEHQVMGDKATKLKDLAQELKCPIISAIQTNSYGDVAMSKQIKWFVNLLGMLRPKTPEEIAAEQQRFGTHTLEVTESRNQGENGMGFLDLVQMPDGDYKRINIHFKFENFNVQEICTLREVADFMNHEVKIDKTHKESPF